MPAFRPRSETELYALPLAALVDHVAAARSAGDREQALTAVHMLLYRDEARMRARVRLRLPAHLRHHAETVAEWVLERVARSALKLAFTGNSGGEWVSWWGTAIDRQVISFWRSAQGKALALETRLPAEHQGAGDAPVDRLGVELDVGALLARACYAEIVAEALSALENPAHVAILRRAIWDDQPSKVVAAELNTSAANVDQVKTRFRRVLRAACERRGVGEA